MWLFLINVKKGLSCFLLVGVVLCVCVFCFVSSWFSRDCTLCSLFCVLCVLICVRCVCLLFFFVCGVVFVVVVVASCLHV